MCFRWIRQANPHTARHLPTSIAMFVSGMDIDVSKAWETYSLRDEQEKYFSDMKGTMLDDRNPAWSEKGKEGRIL